RFHWTNHQNQKTAYSTSDKRPKYRNQCSKGDKNSYQQRIRKIQNCHCNEKHCSQNYSFYTLSCHKISKCFICKSTNVKNIFHDIFRKDRIKSFGNLS